MAWMTLVALFSGRTQRVKVDGPYSSWDSVKRGVPQGLC